MRSPLCKLLGIEYPVIQAAIGGISCPALASAVSNAGGLGSIALTGWGEAGARERLDQAHEMTNHGIIANLLLPYDISAEFNAILATPPKIASFIWGDVEPYVGRVHEVGSLVMVTVGSVDEAKRAADAGADMIVAQGWEAGGHVRGTVASMALVPAVVDAVAPLPVIAAGGALTTWPAACANVIGIRLRRIRSPVRTASSLIRALFGGGGHTYCAYGSALSPGPFFVFFPFYFQIQNHISRFIRQRAGIHARTGQKSVN